MPNLNAKEYASSESIKHIAENGAEFWYAKELHLFSNIHNGEVLQR
jgi:hypothetical protein